MIHQTYLENKSLNFGQKYFLNSKLLTAGLSIQILNLKGLPSNLKNAKDSIQPAFVLQPLHQNGR